MSEPQSWTLPFSEVPQLELSANVAAIKLVAVEPEGTPRLELAGGADARALGVEVTKNGDVVQVHLNYRNGIGMWEFGASAKLIAYVPRNLRARVSCELGRLQVEGLDAGCDLQLSTSAGAILLDHVTGRMVLRASAGKIAGDSLAGTFDVESSAGAVQLGILGLQAGQHRVATNMGSVKVELAPNIAVRIETHTSMGSVRTRYPSQSDAPAVLMLSTDLGAVKVKERSGEENLHGDFPRWDSFHVAGWDPGRWAKGWVDAVTAPFAHHGYHHDGPPPPRPQRKSPLGDEELSRILTMVETGKITAQDAEKLIRAIEER